VAVLAVGAWLVFGFFGFHLLFVDDEVEEAAPVFDAAPAVGAPTTDGPLTTTRPADTTPAPGPVATAPPSPEVVTEARGTFTSLDHPTSGEALVLGNGTGQRFLRFEGFATDNGPDLEVYLVNSSTGDVSDFVSLGELEGNVGEQNYEIPPEVDLTVYDQVMIWCVRFSSGFGEATLTVA
jgi:hypothetical protein